MPLSPGKSCAPASWSRGCCPLGCQERMQQALAVPAAMSLSFYLQCWTGEVLQTEPASLAGGGGRSSCLRGLRQRHPPSPLGVGQSHLPGQGPSPWAGPPPWAGDISRLTVCQMWFPRGQVHLRSLIYRCLYTQGWLLPSIAPASPMLEPVHQTQIQMKEFLRGRSSV